MDAVGGEMNAFTAKEYTCYYARVLDADLPLAIDILSDMVTNSVISPQDVDAERNVVLEEIAMNDDDPTDTVHEAFAAQLFGDTPLGRPVLGTVESINAITRDQIFEHYRARYSPEHLVVSAAGSLDHDDLVQQVAQAFGQALDPGGRARSAPAERRVRRWPPQRGHRPEAGVPRHRAGQPGPGLPRAWPAPTTAGTPWACSTRRSAAACRPGCSRRSARSAGLAYSVYSFGSQNADTGMWGIYVGCLPSKADDVLAICASEVEKLVSGGLTDAELERGKGQMRGSIVLGLEDPSSRMSRIGKSELVYPRLEPVEETLAAIEAVTHDDIRAVASEVLGPAQGPGRGGPVRRHHQLRLRSMIRVGVLGARGRMGGTVVQAVAGADDLSRRGAGR